jgi:hypothetical protein
MEEIALHIHCSGQETREITAPPDLEAGEFIRAYVTTVGLPLFGDDRQPIIYEVDNKETGQKLVAGRSLLENGVRSGHHLYLKWASFPVGPVMPAPVFEKRSEHIPPSPSKWPLIVALALIPVAAAATYLWTKGQDANLRADLTNSQTAVKAANAQVSALANDKANLQQEIDKIKGDTTVTASENARLQGEVTTAQAQVAARDKQISQLNQSMSQLRTSSAAREQDLTNRLAASAQQVQSLQSQLAVKQKEAAEIPTFLQQIEALKQRLSLPTRPRYGWLTWTGQIPKGNVIEIRNNKPTVGTLAGGKLPGIPCTVESADPAYVSIEAAPDAGTGWNRIVFRVNGKGQTTVRLLWISN